MVVIWDESELWEIAIDALGLAECCLQQETVSMVKGDTFAARLSELLKERKLTLNQAASRAGLPKSTIHNWTIGHSPQDFEGLDRLCQVLQTDINYLLLGKAPSPDGVRQVAVNEVFSRDAVLFDGFAHIKVTKLVPRMNVIAEGEDDE